MLFLLTAGFQLDEHLPRLAASAFSLTMVALSGLLAVLGILRLLFALRLLHKPAPD